MLANHKAYQLRATDWTLDEQMTDIHGLPTHKRSGILKASLVTARITADIWDLY